MPNAELAFYLEDLGGGGVQVVFTRLARALAARGRRVELWAASTEGRLAATLPAGIPVVPIACASRVRTAREVLRAAPRLAPATLAAILLGREPETALREIDGLASALRQRRPSILLAATPYRNLEALLARERAGGGTRIVVSEHNDLRAGHGLGRGRHRMLLGRLQRALYPRADAIVAVSRGAAEDVARRSGLPLERVTVIHNPAVPSDVAARGAEPIEHPWLAPGEPPVVLAVGRLGAAKDLETLLRAFARLRRQRPARLVVLGSERRPEKTTRRIAALRALAAGLGSAGDVDFVGYADNPFAWMARAAVLAVSSRNEGFCNVIAEALACGCPVVSTDCPSGPAEILDGGRYGRLVAVGDDLAMAGALAATLAEPRDAERLRARGARFGIENAVHRYEGLLWPTGTREA